MRNILATVGVFSMIVPAAIAADEAVTTEFIGSDGVGAGTATLTEMAQGTLLRVNLRLPDGTHALHIHEQGECDHPHFKSAGGHFNPEGKEHGFDNPSGYHAGDLPNVIVEDGEVTQEIFIPGYTLQGENGLMGRAIMVHEGADDYQTNPAGAAGPRLVCAVIGK